MYYRLLLLTIVLAPTAAFGQRSASHDDGRLQQTGNKTERQSNVAVAGNPSLLVSKTASVNGQDICGVIRITNTGFGPAAIVGIADSLEVHFFNNVPPPGLTAGSTPNWFKVADVPIALPGPIAPRATATINYCFSLCDARDYPGANSMRNVVTVSVANPPGLPRAFGARSNSFTPPFPDCQGCCLPDGSCTDTVPARCTSAGGLPRGTNTDCATTECPQACCHLDDSCSDEPPSSCLAAGGLAKGPESNCASTQCCIPLGSGDCANYLDCCGEHTSCTNGTCCIPLLDEPALEGCHEDLECCNGGRCHDFGGGATGCCYEFGQASSSKDECCSHNGGAVIKNGVCCLPLLDRPQFSCNDDSECCSGGRCHDFGEGATGCCYEYGQASTSKEECCNHNDGAVIKNGVCCLPLLDRPQFSCNDDSECCSGGRCHDFGGGETGCCLEFGQACTDKEDCCNHNDGAVCIEKCCLPNGKSGCSADADCCGSSAACFNGTCCISQFRSGCLSDSDCCSGLFCSGGICEGVNAP